jgi:hypothetical protein
MPRVDSAQSRSDLWMIVFDMGADFAICNDDLIGDNPARKQVILRCVESEDFQSMLLVYQKIGGKMAKDLGPKKKKKKKPTETSCDPHSE